MNSAPPIHICPHIQLKYIIRLFRIMLLNLGTSLLSFAACRLLVNRTEREQKRVKGCVCVWGSDRRRLTICSGFPNIELLLPQHRPQFHHPQCARGTPD